MQSTSSRVVSFFAAILFASSQLLSQTSPSANLVVAPKSGSPCGAVYAVSFDLTNSGGRAGAEVARVYIADNHSKIARPVKELKGFEKVLLQPGETKQVTINLDPRAFAYYDARAKQWHITPENFGILVGRSSEGDHSERLGRGVGISVEEEEEEDVDAG